mgnify:CR=1 FL=1
MKRVSLILKNRNWQNSLVIITYPQFIMWVEQLLIARKCDRCFSIIWWPCEVVSDVSPLRLSTYSVGKPMLYLQFIFHKMVHIWDMQLWFYHKNFVDTPQPSVSKTVIQTAAIIHVITLGIWLDWCWKIWSEFGIYPSLYISTYSVLMVSMGLAVNKNVIVMWGKLVITSEGVI